MERVNIHCTRSRAVLSVLPHSVSMTQKRVLFLHEDRLLCDFFSDKLESAGFIVEVAHDGETGLAIAAERLPHLVVVDPVLPGPSISKLVPKLRGLGGKNPLPVIALPNSRAIFSEAAQEMGAVALSRTANLAADLTNALASALNLDKATLFAKGLAFHGDNYWLNKSLGAAPDVLTDLRHSLHEMTRDGGAPGAFQQFYRRAHGFAEQMALLGEKPLHYLAAQIEALALDLVNLPEQVNASVLRTLSQALDFLATLLPNAVRTQLKDPSSAQVLVVDDEDGARKIIMAAMRMANLKSMAADTPTAALAALGVQGFDLIFLDVGLPEMTGFELCSKVRMISMHEKTPVVFITGMATFQNRVQSSLSGGNDFVGKPFNLSELGLKALIWVYKGQLGQA